MPFMHKCEIEYLNKEFNFKHLYSIYCVHFDISWFHTIQKLYDV